MGGGMTPVIELEDVRHAYPDGTPSLNGVTLRVAPGERIGLIGANGAGKSTLLLHLNGLLMPTAGQVRIDGAPLRRDTLREVRRAVGMVFQNPDDQLFCPTLGDDVAFGPRQLGWDDADTARRVTESLAAVGLAGFEHRCGHHLSMGQKRRAAIATVIALDPRILVLDEPSAYLDPRARRELVGLLGRLHDTQVVASHDLDLIRAACHRVVILAEGRLVADGDARLLLNDLPLLERHGLA